MNKVRSRMGEALTVYNPGSLTPRAELEDLDWNQ